MQITYTDDQTMTIELLGPGPRVVTLTHAGEIYAEIVLGLAKDREQLWVEVARARRLEELARRVCHLPGEIYRDKSFPAEGVRFEQAQLDYYLGVKAGLCYRPTANQLEEMAAQQEADKLHVGKTMHYREGYREGKAITVLALQTYREAQG